MPLYTYNGQLLIVNGALAANANCCCDLTCDALLITYDWVASGQPDLDTGTTFLGNKVGWSCSTCNDDPPYMEWSCDNTNVSALETVKIFFRDALLANQWSGSTTVQLAAGWYRPAGGSNPIPNPGTNPSNSFAAVSLSSTGTRLAIAASFSGSAAGAIYTSTNSGATWATNQSGANWSAVDSSDDGLKLIGIADGTVYRSTDGGATWVSIRSGLPYHRVASSGDGNTLMAVAEVSRLHVSTNGGATWTEREIEEEWRSVAISNNGYKLVAVRGNGLHISTDGGNTWTARVPPPFGSGLNNGVPGGLSNVAITPDGSKLFVTTVAGRTNRSLDDGVTWLRPDSFTFDGQTYPVIGENYNLGLEAVAAAGNTVVILSPQNQQVFVSTDGGITFTDRLNGRYRSVATSSDGSNIVVVGGPFPSGEQSIRRSTDYGVTWSALYVNTLPVVVRVRCLTGGPEQVKTILPGVQDNCTTTNVGYITINEDGTFTLN